MLCIVASAEDYVRNSGKCCLILQSKLCPVLCPGPAFLSTWVSYLGTPSHVCQDANFPEPSFASCPSLYPALGPDPTPHQGTEWLAVVKQGGLLS